MQYFNIQVASQLSGVASATIRAWEKRYNAVVPERAENKHRLYSEKDIEKLALLYKLTEFGQSIGKIAHLHLDELKNIYTTLLHRPYEERHVVTPHHDRVDFEKILMSFHLALSAYKLDIISHELDKARSLLSPKELCLNILVPLFHEIGNRVERNEMSIAQEHTLSAIFSFHMGQMIGQHYQREIETDDLILITTPQGELHEIGILGAALLCVHYNFRFIFLGPNMPTPSLAQAANGLKATAILMGVTRNDLTENETVTSYIDKLKQDLSQQCDIWMGGNLKPYVRDELERKHVSFFPTLHAFDDFLQKIRF